jgi:hypothetical protein
MGLAHAQSFPPDHRVLHRAVWSSLERARLVRRLLVRLLAPMGPLVMGLDDPRERRRGAKIQAQGLDRAPGRSSHRQLVNARGLRWLRLRLWGPRPWAQRVGAWPFMTGRAPAARDHQARRPRHKQLTAGARHRLLVVRRWGPERPLGRVPARRCAVMT